jgi:hypothetical protein
VAANVTAVWGPLFVRSVHAPLEVRVVPRGSSVDVTVSYALGFLAYQCTFSGSTDGDTIVLRPDQSRRIRLPPMAACVVSKERCGGGPLDCPRATERELGDLTATLRSGRVTRRGAQLGLALDLEISGCVVAEKYMGNVPIPIGGAVLHIFTERDAGLTSSGVADTGQGGT